MGDNFNPRSREGAWIEIKLLDKAKKIYLVAPVRERGLKYAKKGKDWEEEGGRSREGAWIEIPLPRR